LAAVKGKGGRKKAHAAGWAAWAGLVTVIKENCYKI
jgi:hypothetical protein